MARMSYADKERRLVMNFMYSNKEIFEEANRQNISKEEYLDSVMGTIKEHISGDSVKHIGESLQHSLFRECKVNRNINKLERAKSNGLDYDLFYLFLFWSSIRESNFNDYFVELFLVDLRKNISNVLTEIGELRFSMT